MRITVIRFFFFAFGEHEFPRITHELLLYGTLHGSLHVYYMWRRRQE